MLLLARFNFTLSANKVNVNSPSRQSVPSKPHSTLTTFNHYSHHSCLRSRVKFSKSITSPRIRRRCSAPVAQVFSGPTVYGNAGSRTPLVWWYLNELGQPFDVGNSGNPHPFGQVPALKEGELEIFESGAILMYLADKYGGLDTPEKRAEASKWTFWANATLDPAIFSPNISATAPRVLDKLDGVLGSKGTTYLVNDEFSVADVAIGSYLLYIPVFFPRFSVAKWTNVTKYMKTLSEREQFEKTFGAQHMARVKQCLKQTEPNKFKLF